MMAPSYKCDWCKRFFWHAPIRVKRSFQGCSDKCAKALHRRTNPSRPPASKGASQ